MTTTAVDQSAPEPSAPEPSVPDAPTEDRPDRLTDRLHRWALVTVRPRGWRWWAQVLVVYAIARLFSAVVFVLVAQHQAANGWTGEHPSYADYVGRMFDATWYLRVAEDGYPHELPLRDDGTVDQNAWAFYPLFPVVVKLLMSVTGLAWTTIAPTLSLLLGAGAVLVIYRLVQVGGARAVARCAPLPLATVTLVSFFPSSPVMQTAYTESLALLLIAGTLYLMALRRYWWAIGVVVLLGLTRSVALPMAAVVLWHGLWRWWHARRGADPLPGRDVWGVVSLFVASVVSGLLWLEVAAWVTGRSDAYFATQAAWRSGPVKYFEPWVTNSKIIFHEHGPWVLAGILLVVVAMLLSPVAFRLGPEIQGWGAAYVAYLVLVTDPWTSTWRFLLLAFPLLAIMVGWVRGRFRFTAWMTSLMLLFLWLQAVWVWQLWRFIPPSDWAP
ncbi:hypothetical protein [Luteimicrobium subarcticum]|uniref:Mannosyltransferase PIG-V n=1 Tax=Luteimicrobium subarcticum TaxID=620910 RepID=A0A2M8WUM7_9MICO|nr:hypothetical protein [Luteimicrobium subarcticum]PJI94608.1 hypothetical protein CLV34_0452 [Luteimicrobium subarcticum]